jgi:hypothetical protein
MCKLDTVFAERSAALDDRTIAPTSTSPKEHNTTAEQLGRKWNVGLDIAKKTLKCTTQKGVRQTLYPIEWHFCTKQAQLRYRQLSGQHGRFYTDAFFSSHSTLSGGKMAQLYINDLSFVKCYPMKQKSDAPDTLVRFIQEVGIPQAIHSDDAPDLMHGHFKQLCKDYQIHLTYMEPYIPCQNRAERRIRELKRMVHRK